MEEKTMLPLVIVLGRCLTWHQGSGRHLLPCPCSKGPLRRECGMGDPCCYSEPAAKCCRAPGKATEKMVVFYKKNEVSVSFPILQMEFHLWEEFHLQASRQYGCAEEAVSATALDVCVCFVGAKNKSEEQTKWISPELKTRNLSFLDHPLFLVPFFPKEHQDC